jgi:hypothetical protein
MRYWILRSHNEFVTSTNLASSQIQWVLVLIYLFRPRSSNKGSIQEAMLFMKVLFPKESMEEKKDEVDVMCLG